MQGDASPHAVFDGIQSFLRKVNTLVRQKQAIDEQAAKDAGATTSETRKASEDDLMIQLVNASVNRIWDDYDKTKDGYLSFDQSREFIVESFGNQGNQFDEQQIQALFNRIDKDQDGKINKGEMAQFLLQLSKF